MAMKVSVGIKTTHPNYFLFLKTCVMDAWGIASH